jgi:hypothetical protein
MQNYLQSKKEFKTWLEQAIGSLRPDQPGILHALLDLDIPIATTNYDLLIEEIGGSLFRPVTFKNKSEVEDFMMGPSHQILHLHGYYKEPGSIVLGSGSYRNLQEDPFVQAVEQAVFLGPTLLIGFGKGLEDPNLGGMIDWLESHDTRHPPYLFLRSKDRSGLPEPDRVRLVLYGEAFTDLPEALRQIAPEGTPSRPILGVTEAAHLAGQAETFRTIATRLLRDLEAHDEPLQTAETYLRLAMHLFRRAGRENEATLCIHDFGEVALKRGDTKGASF